MACPPAPCLEKSTTEVEPTPPKQWTQASTHPWLFSALRDVDNLERLRENWDGHGSPPPSPAARQKTRQLLASVTNSQLPRPSIIPFSGGLVAVIWEAGQRQLQLSIYPDGCVVYALEDGDDVVLDGELRGPVSGDLRQLTRWLISG
jgi:hypothetical protein